MMYFTRTTVMVLAVIAGLPTVLIGGCGSTSEKQKHAYRNAPSIKPIEMPAGLELAHSQESLEIPMQVAKEIAPVDELEKPPRIIESVDLSILDDNNAKPSTNSEKDSKVKSASDKVDDEADGNGKEQKITNGPLKIADGKNEDGDSILVVESDFDQVWPRVKPALIELGFTIDDASRGGQLYEISKLLPTLNVLDKPVHPGDVEPDVKEEYQIHVKSAGEKTEIMVRNKFGQVEGSGLADHLLLQIKELMENPKKAPEDNS